MDPYEIEDTSDWLGCPTELETCTPLSARSGKRGAGTKPAVRKAREDIFGLVQMYDDAAVQRDEAMANLRQSAGQLAAVRRELYELKITANGNKREADRLRRMLEGLIDRPKTII